MASYFSTFLETESWRDMLRPIRDGLDNIRDRLPGSHRDETEDRRKKLQQRRLDILRGFTYFETFEELFDWTPEKVDALQRSTFPLLQRPVDAVNPDPKKLPGARVMVCHDFNGGYHPYESISRTAVTAEQKAFNLEYMQFVETFIYFSHRLITIPPPSWTNNLHRNGVQSLGTFIIEKQTPNITQMFRSYTTSAGVQYPVAEKLAQIASEYGFDGWLINIEQGFTSNTWDYDGMIGLLTQLRSLMGPTRKLVWYDALTVTGKVSHQNALTYSNLPFFDCCGDVLINYAWTEELLKVSRDTVNNEKRHKNMYFGIDVWAQNQPKDRFHPRVTYPKEGGGGTNTGAAVVECGDEGMSACVFGPAWCYEHFKKQPAKKHPYFQTTELLPSSRIEPDGRAVSIAMSRAMWEGTPIPKGTECECFGGRPGSSATHNTANVNAAITKNAMEFAAGTDSFFWTDFHSGYTTVQEKNHEEVSYYQMGSQTVLPRLWRVHNVDESRGLWTRVNEDRPGLTIGLPSGSNRILSKHTVSIILFNLRMIVPHQKTRGQFLKLIIDSELSNETLPIPTVYIKFSDGNEQQVELSHGHCSKDLVMVTLPKRNNPIYITELGVKVELDKTYYSSELSSKTGVELVRLTNISIMLHDTRPDEEFQTIAITPSQQPSATNIRINNHGIDATSSTATRDPLDPEAHLRLCWDVNDIAYLGPNDGIHHPRSHITGVISHFDVYIDTKYVDRVYGLEMVLPKAYEGQWRLEEDLVIRIDCVRFGGAVYTGEDVTLSAVDSEWVVIQNQDIGH
jgi:hypothetical protein